MPGRRAAPLLALLAGACAAPPPPAAPAAASTCPEHVAEAEAWVNHMPGPGGTGRQLIVSARMADAAATAILLRSDASTPDQLVLDIRAAAAAPVPGRLGYREPAPEPLYSQILLRCRGADDLVVREILAVY